jgi:DNA-binding response OmpR family regulator
MDSLDRDIAEAFTEHPPASGPGRILIVGGTSAYQKTLVRKLTERGHQCQRAIGLAAAVEATACGRFDLVVMHAALRDGDGLDLARTLQRTAPSTRAIVLLKRQSFKQAVEALRCGVADVVDEGITADDLATRAEAALKTSWAEHQREERLDQLKVVCKKLVAAREEVSEHLDRLCKDLVSAYQDVSVQMSEVAMASEFRTLLKQELDVEDLLRTALEYLLTKTGPTNAAVFLPDAHGSFELGAYVNYDCPRETITVLLNHLCRAVCPQMADEPEIVSFDDAAAFAEWIGADAGFLAGCHVLGFSCLHDGKCMAVMVLFRSKDESFEESMAPAIDILRTIFAEQVANVIRIHHRAKPEWPKDPLDEYDASDYDEFGFGGLCA